MCSVPRAGRMYKHLNLQPNVVENETIESNFMFGSVHLREEISVQLAFRPKFTFNTCYY